MILLHLILVWGAVGAVDVVYFHIVRLRLSRNPQSRREQVTHLVRLGLFPVLLGWVLFVRAGGFLALLLPLLILFDLLNSVADVLLEPKSRFSSGGLPPGEYLVHMLSMFLGGTVAAVAVGQSWQALQAPPQLRFDLPDVPFWSLVLGSQFLLGTTGLLAFESWGFLRSLRGAR